MYVLYENFVNTAKIKDEVKDGSAIDVLNAMADPARMRELYI